MLTRLKKNKGSGLGGNDYLGYKDSKEDGKTFHAVFDLLREGEEKFESMAERRSETLGQAVEEYRRRYGRKPPKGFELWWNFVSQT